MEIIVDCMACLVTGVLTPVGFRDKHGIVHGVRWSIRGGPYRLCDFGDAGKPREGTRALRLRDVLFTLSATEEP